MAHVTAYHSKELPPLRTRTVPPERQQELMRRACNAMGGIYLNAINCEHLSAKVTASCYWVTAVTFETPDGAEHDGWGAAVGPAGHAPGLVVLVSDDEVPVVVACTRTRPWVERFGGGELPGMEEGVEVMKT